jgi:hypothetical protein
MNCDSDAVTRFTKGSWDTLFARDALTQSEGGMILMIAHRRAVHLFTSALAVLALASFHSVCAGTTIDFEAPTYTTGNLIGQDGWAKNAYYGTLNGNVTVSSASPLGGAQSLSYSETVADVNVFLRASRRETKLPA